MKWIDSKTRFSPNFRKVGIDTFVSCQLSQRIEDWISGENTLPTHIVYKHTSNNAISTLSRRSGEVSSEAGDQDLGLSRKRAASVQRAHKVYKNSKILICRMAQNLSKAPIFNIPCPRRSLPGDEISGGPRESRGCAPGPPVLQPVADRSGGMSESFEPINSIRVTNENFDSCNSCKRLVSRLHELHESKFPLVARI